MKKEKIEKTDYEKNLYHFNSKIAEKYGLVESVILHNIWYWVSLNRKKGTNFHDGKTWTYHTYEDFAKVLPFLTVRQIKYAIKNLETKLGVLISSCKFNKFNPDRTKWYAFSNEAEFNLAEISLENDDQKEQNNEFEPETILSEGSTELSHDSTNLSQRTDNFVPAIPDSNNTDSNIIIIKESEKKAMEIDLGTKKGIIEFISQDENYIITLKHKFANLDVDKEANKWATQLLNDITAGIFEFKSKNQLLKYWENNLEYWSNKKGNNTPIQPREQISSVDEMEYKMKDTELFDKLDNKIKDQFKEYYKRVTTKLDLLFNASQFGNVYLSIVNKGYVPNRIDYSINQLIFKYQNLIHRKKYTLEHFTNDIIQILNISK